MNLVGALGAAFGVDPERFEAQVAAYESRECRLCESTGKVGAVPCPLCGDRPRGVTYVCINGHRKSVCNIVEGHKMCAALGCRAEAEEEIDEPPDRLALVEARWREAGCGDADKGWLIEEVKKLRGQVRPLLERAMRLSGPPAFLDEALNSGDGVYRP